VHDLHSGIGRHALAFLTPVAMPCSCRSGRTLVIPGPARLHRDGTRNRFVSGHGASASWRTRRLASLARTDSGFSAARGPGM